MKSSVKKYKEPVLPDDGRTWTRNKYHLNRDLVKGDILRVLLDDNDPSKGYLYSVCTGNGFGCLKDSRGNAIYVIESLSLSDVEVITQEILTTNKTYSACRWERFWDIYVKT